MQNGGPVPELAKDVMKNAPIEIEIKLNASPAMLAALESHPCLAGSGRSGRFITTYFDTSDRLLEQAGISLRIRSRPGKREQTAKVMSLPCGTVHREEWTTSLTGKMPQIETFPAPIRERLCRILGHNDVRPTSISRITRLTRHIQAGDSSVEVDFDTGTLAAGDQTEQVCELELELVKGRLRDLLRLALDLPLGPDLQWSVVSKSKRCAWRTCANGHMERAAQEPILSEAMNVTEGFHAIGWNCLYQLLANYPLVVASGHHEAIHQCRIAIRRMRVAFDLFGQCLPERERHRLKAGIKAVGGVLGKARDLHVLHLRLMEHAEDAGAQAVLAVIDKAQGEAVQEAARVLASTSFQRLLFELALSIETGNPGNREGDLPLGPFATQCLSRKRHQLVFEDRRIDALGRRKIHRLRIRAKDMRYSACFFRSLWPKSAEKSGKKPFISCLERLQDKLGKLHDHAITSDRFGLFADNPDPIATAQMAAELKRLLSLQNSNCEKLIRQADEALADVRGAARWWLA